jgi:phosphatidylserine/phosphatidylglycerophosphate/cardiolipin synthase-like enzyme
MTWLLLATGFTGAWSVLFVARALHRRFGTALTVDVHFSPKGGCTEVIVRELASARHEVLVLAYSFTSKAIAQALVDAKLRGVHVDIVLDHSNEKEEYSDLHFFLEQGLVPLIDPHHAIAHNKVMVVDGRTILTGSFNFTNQAEQENAENLLVLKGHPELVSAYRKYFATHKGHARVAEVKARPAGATPAAAAAVPHAAHAHRQAA